MSTWFIRNNVIFGAMFIFFLSLTIPVYAQWTLFGKKPIGLVEKELRGLHEWDTDEEDVANDPSKWVALSQKGDIAIVGWKAQKTDKPDTYLVSYTFRDLKDATEKGWWWEVNTKERMIRTVLHDPELKIKYGKSKSNEAFVGLIKGMSQFTVKTLYGEPAENDNSPNINTWAYYTDPY